MNTLDNETVNSLEPEHQNTSTNTPVVSDDTDSNESEVTASYVRGYN